MNLSQVLAAAQGIALRQSIDVRCSEKAPRSLRGASDPILWHACGAACGAHG